jgi:glycosyltransferase involved in cell wall biosynthesis
MSRAIDLSVILSTYQRPGHLRRSLASLSMQRGVTGRFEVIVADDGSEDETHDIVHQFARTVDFPVKLTTHPHEGFRLARCRNDGVRASSGAYLLFTDSDCIFLPDHLQKHLACRRAGVVRAGNSYRLERELSARIDLDAIISGAYRKWVPWELRRQMMRRWATDFYYEFTAHPTKPKLNGCDCGIWRTDFEKVNGFDENFEGWGCEDDDLGLRLRRAGVRITSILRHTRVYHLWHPLDPTHPGSWKNGDNVRRLLGEAKPIRCANGLVPLQSESTSDRPPTRHAA